MRKTREKKKRTPQKKSLYTTGELNRLIDSLFHPLAKRKKAVILIDGAFHALVERDIKKSLKKFVKYNLPHLLNDNQSDSKNKKHKKKRRHKYDDR